eukprot:scaffold109212_cov37-Tisochrysis_lutea.AAC.1
MEAGIDSLGATEAASQLSKLIDVQLPPTIIFDYPSVREIALHILDQSRGEAFVGTVNPHATTHQPHTRSKALIISGMAMRSPGGEATAAAVWQALCASSDAIGHPPTSRWSIHDIPQQSEPLFYNWPTATMHGGFIADIEYFDNNSFGISAMEASVIDPQQRMLLEFGYMALHGAGARRANLHGSSTCVFVGIERPDWALIQAFSQKGTNASVYGATSDTTSVASGRLSFSLGLHGACASIDAACASGLACLHSAELVINAAEGDRALVGAVSLKLLPQPTLAAATAGMLSADGRCKTFDVHANGYVRSDAIASLALSTHQFQNATTLCSSVVRQDGRSASLTAPNGSAQKALLLSTLHKAGGTSADVGTIEAHGTGTSLGDPTESGALALALCTHVGVPLIVGAFKTNIGHSEPVSGLVGLAKATRASYAGSSPGNAQLRVMNPLVQQRAISMTREISLPLQLTAASGPRDQQHLSGVSSFGYSGTIVHAIYSVAISMAHLNKCNPSFVGSRLLNLCYMRRRYTWHTFDTSARGKYTFNFLTAWVAASSVPCA